MIDAANRTQCSGCTACFNACPTGCITFEMDNEGFHYPVIDSKKCINCNICEKVCPIQLKEEHNRTNKIAAFACQNKNEKVRKLSTSGGLFGAIAQYILSNGGEVWGAGFDDNAIVVHKKVECTSSLEDLFGSKYVQSYLGTAFANIKESLSTNHRPILFVGTPCQVEGLYYMLRGIDTSNLITIDLICYGVPSPGIYQKWIESLSHKYHSPVKSVCFRDKKYGYAGVNVKVYFKNNTSLEDRFDAKSFGKTMFSHIGLRPSCYDCQFRSRRKLSDFTLGDFWEIGEYSEKLDDDKGTSILRVNTEKGQKIFDSIAENLEYILIKELTNEDLDKEIKTGAYHVSIPEKRADFFKDSETMKYEDLIQKYLPITKKEMLANSLKPIICRTPFSRMFFKKLKKWKMKKGK